MNKTFIFHARPLCKLFISSVPVSLQLEQAAAGQLLVRMGLGLEGAHEQFPPQGEAFGLANELDQDREVASDWNPHGEDHNGKLG